jgi:hypothetical protein
MKFRDTLILLGILALLGGYVYFFEIRPEDEPPVEEQERAVFDLEADEIIDLTLFEDEAGVEPALSLARQAGENWQIEVPVQEPANDTTVSSTVRRLAQLEATRVLEEAAADVTVYGLGEVATWRVVLTLADGTAYTLLIGDQNPTKTGYYAKKAEADIIYLISSSMVNTLQGWADEPPVQPTPTPVPTETPLPASD